jgi:hypothetical protein
MSEATKGPYRVEQDNPGCSDCGHGATWWVVGPDDTASSTSYGDESEADSLKRALDSAFELGRDSVVPNPWTKFSPEAPPPRSTQLITWDYEFSSASSMYTGSADVEADLEHARIMKYSHWMLSSALRGPPPAELPVIEPVVIEAPPPAPAALVAPAAPVGESVPWEDDIPF